MSLPEVLQRALAAEAAADACDHRDHPRKSTRLWQACKDARVLLSKDYPQVEAWLFDYHHRAERREELSRLVAESK